MTSFFRTVKFRLTIWYALVLTVFLSIFAFLMHAELARTLYRDTDKNLHKQAVSIEVSLEDYLQRLEPYLSAEKKIHLPNSSAFTPEFRLILVELMKAWEKNEQYMRRATVMIRVLGFDHSLVMSNLKGWEKEIIFPDFERDSVFMEKGRSLQTIHFRNKPVRLYYHVIRYKQLPVFVVQGGFPLHDVEQTLARLTVIIFIWIPVAVVASGIAGWFLARGPLSPIDNMIKEARQITAAYLKSRLPRTNTGDELDRLAATLNEMMDRIASSTHAVQEFSSNVSHELKTPLAIIRGEIDLALRKSRSAENLMETLRTIEGEIDGLIRLVDDLMLLVRSDSKQLRFEKNRVNLKDLLENVCGRFRERAARKKINLTSDFQDDPEMVGDAVYLKRLFSNLLDNALKFTNEGGAVSVRLRLDGQKAIIEMIDDGIGIAYEIQEKVFSRFYRADAARTYDGAGLGLNIARAICDAHEGELTLKSNPFLGTTITVTLPSFSN